MSSEFLVDSLKTSRILGIGVLRYENLRRALEALCQQGNHELIASVEHHFQSALWNQTIEIMEYDDFMNAKYDLSNCAPVGADLLDRLSFCEVTYLKMIGRLDYRNEMSYEERKNHYLRQVTFWNDFLERIAPSHAVFFNFPHEMYDYVIYNMCKIKGIRTLIFDDINLIPDTLFLIESIEESCPQIGVEYERLKAFGLEPILTKTKNYFDDFTGEKKNETPALIQELIKDKNKEEARSAKWKHWVSRLPILFKNPSMIFDIDFWYRLKYSMRKQERQLFDFYDNHAISQPDLQCKYIYLALQYQPECSSCPMGGAFVEQHLIAEIIAKNLPMGYRLYIKEHPLQKKYGRSVKLYEHITALPNTFLIDREYSSFTLIENSQAVATITGTAGWEAFLKGKPVLKFGHSFYQFAPGVFKIRTVKQTQDAMQKILQGLKITETEKKRYLEALEKASIDGWSLDFLKKPMTSLKTKDVIANITKALQEKISTNESQMAPPFRIVE